MRQILFNDMFNEVNIKYVTLRSWNRAHFCFTIKISEINKKDTIFTQFNEKLQSNLFQKFSLSFIA